MRTYGKLFFYMAKSRCRFELRKTSRLPYDVGILSHALLVSFFPQEFSRAAVAKHHPELSATSVSVCPRVFFCISRPHRALLLYCQAMPSSDYDSASLPDLLPLYYRRLFPFSQYYRWLNYGGCKYPMQTDQIAKLTIAYRNLSLPLNAYGLITALPFKLEKGNVIA